MNSFKLAIISLGITLFGSGLPVLGQVDNNNRTVDPVIKPSQGVPDSILYSGNNSQINDSTKLLILNDYTNKKFSKKRDQKRYDRLLAIVKKVYPLAKLAGTRMEQYAAAVDTLKRGQVEDFVAEIEDEVQYKYGADLRKLTFKEGIVLLKLLDRQTSKTGYVIIKELKSGFSAMIWQSLASLFDYDLKDEYNPNDVQEDQWIEEICVMIDAGRL